VRDPQAVLVLCRSSSTGRAILITEWAKVEANASLLVKAGAVEEIMQLCARRNPLIIKQCAKALHAMAVHHELARVMIARGAVGVITKLMKTRIGRQHEVIADLVSALVLLTAQAGVAGELVAQGIVEGLTKRKGLWGRGVRSVGGLLNLTYSESVYPGMDTVLRALIQLARDPSLSIKNQVAQAMLNLSKLRDMHRTLLKEDVISVSSAKPST
jgi:hypothetical protein